MFFMKTEIKQSRTVIFGEWVIRTEPSVNKDGIEIRVCKKCLYFEERIIEAPHTHVFDAPEYKWEQVMIYIYNSFYRNDYILISGTETEEVILTAQEIAGYKFTGWYDGEVLISEEMEYTFTVEDREYKFAAKYEKE